jgi:hypothetical protein
MRSGTTLAVADITIPPERKRDHRRIAQAVELVNAISAAVC